jgi:hypothetical protein
MPCPTAFGPFWRGSLAAQLDENQIGFALIAAPHQRHGDLTPLQRKPESYKQESHPPTLGSSALKKGSIF